MKCIPTVAPMILMSLLVSGAGTGSSRPKRYVVFPEGSSFSIALCLTVHTLTPDPFFTEGINWGISYDLPNESRSDSLLTDPFLGPSLLRRRRGVDGKLSEFEQHQLYSVEEDREPYLQRRFRRDLYGKIERVIEAIGYDGRACILRALCEAAQRLMPQGGTLVEEMVRVVFTLPLEKMFEGEPREHQVYAEAHRAGSQGRSLEHCRKLFPRCGFSLVELALGGYDAGSYGRRMSSEPGPNEVDGDEDDYGGDGRRHQRVYAMK